MKTTAFCPISTQKIDENLARFNGGFVTLIVIAAIVTQSVLPLLFLTIDFTFRATGNSKYSPLAFISKNIIRTLKITAKPVNAGPKIFAARIGLLFSVLALIFNALELNGISTGVLSVFGFCAFLESAFGFCVACQIYPFVYKLAYASKN